MIWLTVLVTLVFTGSYYVRNVLGSSTAHSHNPPDSHQVFKRVIGLSPSIVEIIYLLGLEDSLVGVSRFSNYPPAAKKIKVVGGYVDLNYEAVLTLEPDCVVLLDEQRVLAEKLSTMGIHTIMLDHASTHGIIESISTLGKAFHKETLADNIVDAMQTRIDTLTREARNSGEKPRILVCIERDTNSPYPDRVIAAGNKGVHQEYINMVGGVNAYQGLVAYPLLSREKLIHINPDIIIELVREDVWKEKGRQALTKQWQQFSELRAVQDKRIIFLHEHLHTIPGPRFIDTLEIFAHAVSSAAKTRSQ